MMLFGFSSLLPWNAVLTSLDYFSISVSAPAAPLIQGLYYSLENQTSD